MQNMKKLIDNATFSASFSVSDQIWPKCCLKDPTHFVFIEQFLFKYV